jgi:DHA2 family multidrug resistance protein
MRLSAAEMAEPAPPLGVWIGCCGMMLGAFMALLDIQVVASSLGGIQAGVGATRDEISWVQTSYLIAEVIGIPLASFWVRALSTRVMFTGMALLFAVFSVGCAFAWDIESLIVFRALQGFVGGAMIPTTMATLVLTFPKRFMAMTGTIFAMVATAAPAIGPTLGGYVTEALEWRALFWLNVIPSVFVVWSVWRFIRVDKPDADVLKNIDVMHFIGLALMLGCTQYLLEEGPKEGWFESLEIVMLAIAALLGGVLFFWRASVSEHPIVDLRPFRTPTFAIGAMLAAIIGLALFGAIFLQPMVLISVHGLNSLQIGHYMLAQGMTMFIAGPLMGFVLRPMRDVRPIGVLGFLLVALSCFMQSHMTAQTGYWEFALPQIIRAVGLVSVMQSVMMPTIASLPPHLVHSGAGLFNTVRNLGGAFGLAVLASQQTSGLAFHRQQLYAAADPSNTHIQAMIDANYAYLEAAGAADPERQSLMNYASLLDREALVMTFNDMFLLVAVVVFVAAFLMLLLAPPKLPPRADVAAIASGH